MKRDIVIDPCGETNNLHTFKYRDSTGFELPYRLYTPNSTDPLPLVILLHGAGERGSDNLRQLKHGVASLLSEAFREEFPCYLLVPQCPEGSLWAEVDWTSTTPKFPENLTSPARACLDLIDQICTEFSIDSRRLYLTGLSMGGFGTWDWACRLPDKFAAILPICGGISTSQLVKIQVLPVWTFHGALDDVVSVELSRNAFNALQDLGSTVKYTEYPNHGHDSWTDTYSNIDVWSWLFAQTKKPTV
jgi:predicted peptidase